MNLSELKTLSKEDALIKLASNDFFFEDVEIRPISFINALESVISTLEDKQDFLQRLEKEIERYVLEVKELCGEGELDYKTIQRKRDSIKLLLLRDTRPKQKNQTLTIDEIALLHAYSEKPVTEENAKEIVRKYGHTSSLKLLNQYNRYSAPINRKGVPKSPTPLKIRNKIKKIEKVIQLLPKDKRAKALDEVEILKTTLKDETF